MGPGWVALPQVGNKVEAIVELVKPDYVILSLPESGNKIAFAATSDVNTGAAAEAQPRFSAGQKLSATVAVLAGPDTGGCRLHT
jgi:rRNA biogenesis protein RRP5